MSCLMATTFLLCLDSCQDPLHTLVNRPGNISFWNLLSWVCGTTDLCWAAEDGEGPPSPLRMTSERRAG